MPELTEQLKSSFPQWIVDAHDFRGDETVIVRKQGIVEIARFLKETPGLDFEFLMDLTAVDYLGRKPRFEVVYHFFSLKHRRRLRVKALVDEADPAIDTLMGLWPGANWFEREVWDMFGIQFKGHPNLKRILMYEEFVGHPLRKDYPVSKRQPLIGPKT